MIEITVELDYPDSGSYAEVSGSATQTSGAYANFYDIKEATPGLTGPTGPYPTVTASAHPLPPNKFKNNEDVTFVIRVSKVWLTVLGPNQGSYTASAGSVAEEGTTWNQLKKVSHITDDDSSNGENPS
jgi:hypothetical protein